MLNSVRNELYNYITISERVFTFYDTTLVALIISEGDGSANRAEVQQLVTWCSEQNLILILRRKKKSS